MHVLLQGPFVCLTMLEINYGFTFDKERKVEKGRDKPICFSEQSKPCINKIEDCKDT